MDKEMKKVLRLFQCDFNRAIEEDFAQVLTENEKVRLFFINENAAFTDGKNIIVDPAVGDAFVDTGALKQAEHFMGLGHAISSDPWYALRMLTRGQNIHECLHILYTDFPLAVTKDCRIHTKARAKTLALIANIIEDAFIEAAGCSVFDNLELYLRFHRMTLVFCNASMEGTVDRAFKSESWEESSEKAEPLPLIIYLNYMTTFLLYPMIKQDAPPESVVLFVEKTKQSFLDGSVCSDPDERYTFVQRIFDLIEPLIPESEEDIDDAQLHRMLSGTKTHSANANAILSVESKGRKVTVSRRLFTDLNGNPLPNKGFSEQMMSILDDYRVEKAAALKIIEVQPVVVNWKGNQYDCHVMHKDIQVVETKPKPNLNLRKAYQNIYSRYRININSYNSRFLQLLKARIPTKEERRLFGTGISSRYLAEPKKRYWYRHDEGFGIPDLAVMLLIDGSGSMMGARRESAMVSSVILHEVLKRQGITHAIVEHRAGFEKPIVEANILVGFDAKNEDKYNLMTIGAGGDNRDGLTLFWAERYLVTNTSAAQKLMIVLADGMPAHAYDEYYPPVSSKDTENAAMKIVKRGTKIIAVALDNGGDDEYACYDSLTEIYPTVVSCTELEKLTGQLLGIIAKHLE